MATLYEISEDLLALKDLIDSLEDENGIVTGKQIGRASCRERVSSPV